MPEKIVQGALAWWDAFLQASAFAAIGVLFGLGQILRSKEKPSLRIAIGRCITTTGLAMSAGVALLAFPGAPLIALVGVAAAFASLGTSGLERLIQRGIGKGD